MFIYVLHVNQTADGIKNSQVPIFAVCICNFKHAVRPTISWRHLPLQNVPTEYCRENALVPLPFQKQSIRAAQCMGVQWMDLYPTPTAPLGIIFRAPWHATQELHAGQGGHGLRCPLSLPWCPFTSSHWLYKIFQWKCPLLNENGLALFNMFKDEIPGMPKVKARKWKQLLLAWFSAQFWFWIL